MEFKLNEVDTKSQMKEEHVKTLKSQLEKMVKENMKLQKQKE
jgi:hypothetical protein